MNYGQNTQDIRSLVKNYTIISGLVLATIGGYAAFNGVFNILWDKWLYWVLFGSNQDFLACQPGSTGCHDFALRPLYCRCVCGDALL